MTYVYGYIFDNVTALKTLHLKSLPFQCKEVARSDADEGATQPTTWCTVFKTWPSTVYVPMEYLEYYKNPDPKHVVSMHFQDLLNTLTSESEEWTKWTEGSATLLEVQFGIEEQLYLGIICHYYHGRIQLI